MTSKQPDIHARPSSEGEDDISSLCTLEFELSEYMERSASSAFHEMYPGVEMIDYDFIAERQNLYSTNLLESTAHLVKGCLGAGILGMHEAYMYGGIWTSLGVTATIGFLVPYCMLASILDSFILFRFLVYKTLVNSAQKMYIRLRVPRLSYPDLAEAALATGPMKLSRKYSKAFRYIVDSFLFLDFNGTCCIFQIMIAKTLKQVMESISSWQVSMSVYILIVAVPLLSLCLIRSLKYLATFSLVADLIIAICVITTMGYSISMAGNLSDRPAWKSVHGLLRIIGVCIYSVNGIGVILPIENHMRRPQYIGTVIQCGMPIVIAFVTIIGFFGYWAWGEECRSPFTIHMPSHTVLIIMQGLLTTTLGVTFAVHFWVPFRIVWHYIGKRYKKHRGIWERLHRAIHVLVISCLSIAFPSMVRWMIFVGNFFAGFMVFVIPAIIEILITWSHSRKYIFMWLLLKNTFLILLGVVLCGGAFYAS